MDNLEVRWELAIKTLEKIFGEEIDLQAALFLIGVQELGKGPKKFSKKQKMEVMHIAVCKLLSDYGYYKFAGYDKDGWPHYDRQDRLPKLEGNAQEKLMKEAIINYLEKQDL